MFLLYKMFEINCMILYIPFDSFKKIQFKHLIEFVERTKNDICIVSKLFLNIFFNLPRHHFIYWRTTTHYNYNNLRFEKSKVFFCNLF
jgi:hypothetical protein